MKRLLCLLLSALLIFACTGTAWAFTDTAELNDAELQALESLTTMGVVSGYPDGSFRPGGAVSRAEFAKMLCLFAQEQEATATAAFGDVPPGAWYAGWVARAAQLGWINGYPGNEYRPQGQITQQEITTVLVRLSQQNTTGFAWPQDYIAAAEEAGYLADIDFAATIPASRIIACQMLYNALPPQQEEKPSTVNVLRGVVTAIGDNTVTVMNAQGSSATYEVGGGVLPQNLFPGAYIEAETADKYLLKLAQVFNASKEIAYWDIALDGKTAQIGDSKYNIEDAEIFVVSYTLSKPYSAETFVSAAMIDRDILSLGGRLATEMAVVLEENSGVLKRAYLVNASVVISGGRLDVVEGEFNSAKGQGIGFLGRSGGLPLDSGLSMPNSGSFIHYSLRNGEISDWHELYNANASSLPDVSQILSGGNDDSPYAWVNALGKAYTGGINNIMQDGLPLIISMGGGQRTVQLGAAENSTTNYALAEGCLIYEVKNGKISSGSKSSMEQNRPVIALVNRYGEICYMFCLMD